jgi:CRISPR-associated protein Cas6
MTEVVAAVEMTDLVYAVSGTTVPRDYHELLGQALARALPWLADEPGSGALGLRIASGAGPMALLPQRARLSLRVPRHQAEAAAQLCGRVLDLDGAELTVGALHERALQPVNTLYADFVCLDDRVLAEFERAAEAALRELGVEARTICGRACSRRTGERILHGHPLALHGLKPAHSLRVQQLGLGSHRHIGCGLFVPHKAISGLD